MKIKTIITLTFLIISMNIIAQNQNKFYIADSLYIYGQIAENEKDTTKAIKLYKEAESYYTEYFNYISIATLYLGKKDYKKTYKYSCLFFENGGSWESYEYFVDTNVNFKKAYPNMKEIYNKYNSNYLKKLNIKLLIEINKIDYEAYLTREYVDTLDVKNERGDFVMRYYDSISFNNLIDAMNLYGIPCNESIGGEGMEKLWLFLWHQRGDYGQSEAWKKTIQIINKGIQEGKIKPSFLAWIEDFYLTVNNKPQKYGLEADWSNHPPTKYKLIEDIKNVDKRRHKIGLVSLKADAQLRKFELPAGYENK